MKKLCFGTLFTLLCQIKNSTNQNKLYLYLVKPYDNSDIEPDTGSVGNRKAGIDDIPQTEKDFFNVTEVDKIVTLYRTRLSKALKPGQFKKAFILAIKDVIKNDSTLLPNEVIGSPNLTKQLILNSEKFDFYYLVANIMKFCSSITNSSTNANIREITSTFINDKLSEANSVFLSDTEYMNDTTPISLTIDPAKFASVFREINPNTYVLSLPNPNKIKLFRIKVNNKEFNKAPISDFILDNISQYVYSRTKIKDISSHHNVRTISTRAIRELVNNSEFADQKTTFCEIMLYSFMESSLYSPKILSGFEINGTGSSKKHSSGIYLLPAGTISANNQIVFGCTQAHDNLKAAIDDVLSQACNIKDNRNDEIHLLDPSILNTIMESEVSKFIKNIVTPSSSSSVESDDAFGLFMTYSIDVPGKDIMTNTDYRSALEVQMDADIKANLPYLFSQISSLGLAGYSFYFFILPLDKVEDDTQKIMTLSVGGGD